MAVPNVTINNTPPAPAVASVPSSPFPEIAYGSAGQSAPPNIRDPQTNIPGVAPDAFQCLKSIPLPYYGYTGERQAYIGASTSIDLCSRAWAGFPAARNAIEVAVEFSSQPLYIKCKNKTVKRFFQEWFHAIRIKKFVQEFFREYYRSGNVFMLLFNGKFGPAYYQNFQDSFGAKENKIPIRYEILNPTNIFVPVGLAAPYTYVRLLSTYEIQRLKNPLTPQDKQVYDSLPPVAKEQITNYGNSPLGIYIPLDPEKLRFAFYKKQSYEPLAVPMIWPVLPDIEWKLMLKKQDKALVQNVERILLLVTTGEAPNQWNGGKGINPKNITNLQSLLSNATLNRVLVADYSTKANFIQPDLSALGPEKYAVVNQDIKEGLQSILAGDDKFANAQMKAQIFIQRLEEGQTVFLDEFLEIEVQRICETMGFRDKPKVGFVPINLQDQATMSRVITQLGQLGILTGKQTVKVLNDGVLPDADEMDEAQTEYLKDRDDGKYYPLVGDSQKQDGQVGGGGRPVGTGVPKSSNKVGPIGKGAEKGEKFSLKSMVETMKARSNLESYVEDALLKKTGLKELNEAQKNAAASLTFSIMASAPKEKWTKAIAKKSISDLPKVSTEIMDELDEIRENYRLNDAWEAAVVKNSKV